MVAKLSSRDLATTTGAATVALSMLIPPNADSLSDKVGVVAPENPRSSEPY